MSRRCAVTGTAAAPRVVVARAPAMALQVAADRAYFSRSRFYGWSSDTLFHGATSHRAYFADCFINGTYDFIWGAGSAVFERCRIEGSDNIFAHKGTSRDRDGRVGGLRALGGGGHAGVERRAAAAPGAEVMRHVLSGSGCLILAWDAETGEEVWRLPIDDGSLEYSGDSLFIECVGYLVEALRKSDP